MNSLPGAVETPTPEVVVDGFPARHVVWQQPPSTSGADQVQDCVQDCQAIMFRGAPSKFGRRHQSLDSFPLFVAQIAGIAGPLHAFAIAHPGQTSTFQTRSNTFDLANFSRTTMLRRLGEGSSVKFYWLILGLLAVWRITHLLYGEDGPWNLLLRLRHWAGQGFWATLLDCFACLSLWIAVPFAFLLGDGWKERLLLLPALSAGAIMLERLTSRDHGVPPAHYSEDKEV